MVSQQIHGLFDRFVDDCGCYVVEFNRIQTHVLLQ